MRLLAPVITILAVLILAIFRAETGRDHQARAEDPSIDKLASELKRVSPKDPDTSRGLVQLHKDFRIELVAGEPLIHDPAAIDFDENGRIFVAQLPEYNAYAAKDFKGQGSVHMLTDSNGDGRYDRRTVYADKLHYPTAVACWDGGVFIGAAPDLLYAKDTDGDGVADIRRVVMTGFGKDHAGEAHLNSMRWGFDNRFHLSTSLSGGEITVSDEKERDPRSVRNRGMIIDPRHPAHFELTSGAGQHGMSMDNWGHKFVCSNSVPAQVLMYDDRYVARNPHLKAPAVAVDIAPQGKFTKLYRISPPEPWRALRTNLRRTGRFKGSDEGGTPFGFFTGATGVTIYRGNAWPKEFHGNLLVGDIANNLIYRATLSQDGLQLVATRADKEVEFLSSKDIWFRPVQMANAPDGTLYVLDFCRELIEGAAFLPPEFLKHIDVTSGNDRGRIYRIAPKDFKYPGPPRLGEASSAELV
ncbi:MAG: PVC-type heme-binding CxxCH protein, partial [Pirellulaceae bacterium]